MQPAAEAPVEAYPVPVYSADTVKTPLPTAPISAPPQPSRREIQATEKMIRNAQLETQTLPKTTMPNTEPRSAVPANIDNAVKMPPLPTTSASKMPKPPADPASGVAADTRAVFGKPSMTSATVAKPATTVTSNTAQVANAPKPMQQRAPSAPVAGVPSTAIAKYAMANQHPIGTAKYSRGFLSKIFTGSKCDSFTSPEKAQMAFLANGGPEQDTMGLDPDGDGYACGWDPAPYRHAVNG